MDAPITDQTPEYKFVIDDLRQCKDTIVSAHCILEYGAFQHGTTFKVPCRLKFKNHKSFYVVIKTDDPKLIFPLMKEIWTMGAYCTLTKLIVDQTEEEIDNNHFEWIQATPARHRFVEDYEE